MQRHTFFVTCAPGVEDVLHAECKALGLARLERQVGGARFEGTLVDGWRANLWLRTAVRVLLRLARFQAPDGDALYEAARAIEWERWLAPDGTLFVDAQTRESALDHSRFVEQRTKDAIVDRLRAADGTRPGVDREAPDLRVHVHLFQDRATLSLDTSGDSLHKRGWRVAQGRAPLSETLAAALVSLSGWDGRAPLVDPFCGSGTVLVETALIAANVAPGLFRERFGFERWLDHDAAAYARVRAEAEAARRPLSKKWRLVGSDHDPQRVEEARNNLAAVGFEDHVQLDVRDARDFAPRPGWNAWIVTNPPYGERMGEEREVSRLYAKFGAQLALHCSGYRLALLTASTQLAEALGVPHLEWRRIVHGGRERILATGPIG